MRGETVVDRGAVCLYFDRATEEAVRLAWSRIAEEGLSSEMPDAGWRPHLTLSGCVDLCMSQFVPRLEAFAAQTRPMRITLSAQGSFYNGVTSYSAYLAATPTPDLLDLHKRHDRLISEYTASVATYYSPYYWVPHCTLAINLSSENQAKMARLMNLFPLPIGGRIEKIAIVRVARPRVQELAVFPLEK